MTTGNDVMTALRSLDAVSLRKGAREIIGVQTIFHKPNAGPRYLKTETILTRCEETVARAKPATLANWLERINALKIGKPDTGPMPTDENPHEGKDGVKPEAQGQRVQGGRDTDDTGKAQGQGKGKDTEHTDDVPDAHEGEGKPEGDAKEGEGEGDTDKDESPIDAAVRKVVKEMIRTGKGPVDEKMVKALIEKYAPKGGEPVYKGIEILNSKEEPVKLDGVFHKAFGKVLMRVKAGLPTLLVGPAGTGKSHLARQVIESLKKKFRFNVASPIMSSSVFEGRKLPNADGRMVYSRSEIVASYEDGDGYCLDEIDNMDPSCLTLLNTPLANGHFSVPQRDENPLALRHKGFRFIACANTFGNGADRVYVGRNQLDGATLDRMRVGTVLIDYDRDLERTVPVMIEEVCVGTVPKDILEWGWAVREKIQANKMRRILSMRNMIDAAKLVAVGGSREDWLESYFSDWSEDDKAKIGKDLQK